MNTHRLEIDVARHVLGLLRSTDMPAVAVCALEDGCDSASLRILAGLSPAESDCAARVFAEALSELQIPEPSKREAVKRLARETAKGIVSGSIAPYEGAREIWELSLLIPNESIPELDTFAYAASEWEGRPESHAAFARGITDAARELAR